ncbi:hypothetical protein [Streptomyces sp. NPDC008092]|uniref:hypothetical protein n=1 Tax=Streptomyces sp. NPDC008092 TaxID=3364808 RepID=UPI0036E03358
MPLIDLDLPEGLVSATVHDRLVVDLGRALLRAEGLPAEGPILDHVAVYTHLHPAASVRVLAGPDAPTPVRIRVTTAAGSLRRDSQRQLVADMTRLIVEATEDESIAQRTLVLHSEIAEGGWGDGGIALGREDFDQLNASARSAGGTSTR